MFFLRLPKNFDSERHWSEEDEVKPRDQEPENRNSPEVSLGVFSPFQTQNTSSKLTSATKHH